MMAPVTKRKEHNKKEKLKKAMLKKAKMPKDPMPMMTEKHRKPHPAPTSHLWQ